MEEKLTCKKCGCEGAQDYPLVTIRTMTVRSGGSTQKYQALGEVLSVNLCPQCIDAWISQRSKPQPQYRKAAKLPLLLIAVAIAVHFLGLEGLIRWVLCLLFGGFGIAVAVSEITRIKRETAEISAGKGKFSRDHMIEELAAALLPAKHQDAHLTYLLRKRVLDEKQLYTLSREYGISGRKLASIRSYLLTTPESEVNKGLEEPQLPEKKKGFFKTRNS
ncbi:MAG: hypothetical protein IJ214_12840 [Clostridia bacterium]|nr:hypothetical protein [Clostridia bacterium]